MHSHHAPQLLWESNLLILPKAVMLELKWLIPTLSIDEAVLAMDEKVYAALHKLRVQSSFEIFNFPVHKYSEKLPHFLTQDAFSLLTGPCSVVPRP